MMKEVFSCPRFTGARFDEHTLPVEVARDLAAYSDLVQALAKHLYMLDHPRRQRVPRGFAEHFRLDIERIEAGSTQPVLALVMAGALGLQGASPDYFAQARDLIAECVAAPDNQLPTNFPSELLIHFNQVGRSLREGEAMELKRANDPEPAVLTPAKRKSLVLAAERTYEKEVEFLGSIGAADWDKSSFRLSLEDGKQLTVTMPDSFRTKVGPIGGKTRHLVLLKGVAAYDAWDQPKKMISIDSLEIMKNHAIATRLDELAQLRDGWFEGTGKALNEEQLAIVAGQLSDYPERLILPMIVPTPEGNLLLEWLGDNDPSLDINLSNMQASFHAFSRSGEDIEQDFDLSDAAGWKSLYKFLDRIIEEAA